MSSFGCDNFFFSFFSQSFPKKILRGKSHVLKMLLFKQQWTPSPGILLSVCICRWRHWIFKFMFTHSRIHICEYTIFEAMQIYNILFIYLDYALESKSRKWKLCTCEFIDDLIVSEYYYICLYDKILFLSLPLFLSHTIFTNIENEMEKPNK